MRVSYKFILSVLFICILTASILLTTSVDLLRVDKIDISMNETAVEKYLLQRIRKSIEPQLASFSGKYIWQIDLDDIARLVKSDSRVDSIHLQRKFPNKISLKIRPQKPLFLLIGKGGGVFPVANDGSLLPPLSSSEALDLPILRGVNYQKNLKLRRAAVEMIQQIPREGLFSRQSISEIHFNKKYGYVFNLIGLGEAVRLGRDDFAYKSELVEKVLGYLSSEQLKGKIIDARFSRKVVVRLRKDTD